MLQERPEAVTGLADTVLVPAVGDAARHTRSQRVAANLARLRRPLAGLELYTNDHAVLTWIADQDDVVVAAMVSLLDRARVEPVTGTAPARPTPLGRSRWRGVGRLFRGLRSTGTKTGD